MEVMARINVAICTPVHLSPEYGKKIFNSESEH